MPVLLVLFACGGEPAAPPVEQPLTRAEQVRELKSGLSAAHRAWSDGRREEAATGVQEAYHAHFEVLEAGLRQVDPLGTLELEYRFGHLAHVFGRPGNPVVVIEDVRALDQAIDAAIARLPAEPPPGAAKEPADP